jgi:hypothetical protein
MQLCLSIKCAKPNHQWPSSKTKSKLLVRVVESEGRRRALASVSETAALKGVAFTCDIEGH